MIARLSGIVVDRLANIVVLDVNGVGYEIICSSQCLAKLSEDELSTAIVYTDVKEDSLKLYGFADQLEKEVFCMLIAVKGVGARSACEIVSSIEKLDLLRIIGSGEAAKLQRVKGIGKKTAERIVLELRDKVADYVRDDRRSEHVTFSAAASALDDALAALIALGFPAVEAQKAIDAVSSAGFDSNSDSGLIVKEALKYV